ncbi:rab-GTPase-TBC domain-containing protein [Fimicolochytrium jonesii]|uniref:rab-GTPase-TBC domain-containing protein n=1 Tax=Fimicolochytrium jonesii TaxID=1396493 RepID=UPI0022FDEB56|nr:rab-GTPase-TBC domain-containing protein [Fimicolochytrium jonesii]KAI8816929.1 rab-GTPase-TBC domain-containing protein [Fimicolochytrium jonesii]
MYASQWFLTLYTYNFPLSFVFRIFDIIFAEGAIETILRFSIAILKKNEPLLLKEEEFENVLDVLKGDRLFAAYNNDAEAVVQDIAMEYVRPALSDQRFCAR